MNSEIMYFTRSAVATCTSMYYNVAQPVTSVVIRRLIPVKGIITIQQ